MSPKLSVGTRVQVKPGVSAPDVPEVSIAGWTGRITQISKKKAGRQFFVEWDQATLEQMPPEYLSLCEERMLFHAMSCLTEDSLGPVTD